MNFYPFHPGDYMLRTAHLEPVEDVAYRRLLDLYYTGEKPLEGTAESLARVVRLRNNVDEVRAILQEFFTDGPDGWRHAHCDEVIAQYREKAARSAENGKKGGRPRKQEETGQKAENNPEKTQQVSSGMLGETGQQANQEPKPKPKPEEKEQKALVPSGDDTVGYSPAFEACWAKYPKRAGGNSKKAAFKAWSARLRDGVTTETLTKAVQAYAAEMLAKGKIGTEYVKQAATFLGPNEHWSESLQSNVHPIRKGLGADGKLLAGYFWHAEDFDLPVEKRRILSHETHDVASGYSWAYLRSKGRA